MNSALVPLHVAINILDFCFKCTVLFSPPQVTEAPPPQAVQEPAPVPVVQELQPHPPMVLREEPKGPRPVSSVPIPGSPWSVVWTSNDKHFFFDATSRVSVWTVPQELVDNPQVAKVLDEPPGKKSESWCYLL